MRERISHLLLTPREIDVLAAIGDGFGNKAIARKLDISLHTVKFHIESLFRSSVHARAPRPWRRAWRAARKRSSMYKALVWTARYFAVA
jgi:FixJ family two-component response regulator